MISQFSRRTFMLQMLLALAACTAEETVFNQQVQLVIGTIAYGQEKQTVERLNRFRQYLSEQLKAIVQIEPAFNERIAVERIKRNSWSLVFAPPGLAALAIDNYQYSAILPLQLRVDSRSVIIVRKDSPVQEIPDLRDKTVALGQKGSATGYYFPLYNLYGLTLASILFAATPNISLEWLSEGKVDAVAVSLQEFNLYKSEFSSENYRILFQDSHRVPSGAVLVSPKIDKNRADIIRNTMRKAPLYVVQEAKYIPNASPPDYKYMIEVVNRVTSITENIDSKPVRLF